MFHALISPKMARNSRASADAFLFLVIKYFSMPPCGEQMSTYVQYSVCVCVCKLLLSHGFTASSRIFTRYHPLLLLLRVVAILLFTGQDGYQSLLLAFFIIKLV